MASPATFPEATYFVGPNDRDGGSPGGFPMVVEWDGSARFVSSWALTREELEEVQRTGRIWLEVRSDRLVHPGVRVSGAKSAVVPAPLGTGGVAARR